MSLSKDSEAHLAEIHKHLESFSLEPAARDWVIKALHPAASHEAPGIPDPFSGQIVTPDYKDSAVIGPNSSVSGDWDLLIVQLPGDNIGFGWATGPSGVDFTAQVTPANTTFGCTWNQASVPGLNVSALQIVSTSGVVSGAVQSSPTIVSSAQPWRFRRRYAGITAYMTASALNDQGTVFASSFSTTYQRGQPDLNPNFQSGGFTAFAVAHSWMLPFDETSLQLDSPKPYVGQARGGVYVPARFNSYDFADVEQVRASDACATQASGGVASVRFPVPGTNATYNTLTTCYPEFNNQGQHISWPSGAFAGNNVAGTSQSDSSHSAMTPTVIIFRGLANAAKITVRSYFGLELVVQPQSSFRQFCKPAPPYSQKALEVYNAVVDQLAYCYPASYNSFGDLLNVVKGIASTLYGPLRSVVGRIPVVGGIVQTIGDAVLGHPSGPPAIAPSVSHLAEVQRVSTSDPRPVQHAMLGTPIVKSTHRISTSEVCPQCVSGVKHKHRRRRRARTLSRTRSRSGSRRLRFR